MTDERIEKYAVELVAAGARSCAEDDMDEDGYFADYEDWVKAVALALRMARAIGEHRESFLAWRRVTEQRERM